MNELIRNERKQIPDGLSDAERNARAEIVLMETAGKYNDAIKINGSQDITSCQKALTEIRKNIYTQLSRKNEIYEDLEAISKLSSAVDAYESQHPETEQADSLMPVSLFDFHNILAEIVEREPDTLKDFYKYDYKARSSRAKAVFAELHKNDQTDEQPLIEHIRWHLFMLSEGYQYDPLTAVPEVTKLHIAKLHSDMTQNISPEEMGKDDSVEETFRKVSKTLKENQIEL